MRILLLKDCFSSLHSFNSLSPSSVLYTKTQFRHISKNPSKDATLNTGTGDRILSHLHQILEKGEAPKKFNFSQDIFDQHAVRKDTNFQKNLSNFKFYLILKILTRFIAPTLQPCILTETLPPESGPFPNSEKNPFDPPYFSGTSWISLTRHLHPLHPIF